MQFLGQWGGLWRSGLASVSAAGNESAAGSAVVRTTTAARIFSDWYEASNEQVVRGFLRVLRLPPLLQMVMVQSTKTQKINS
jgi:hypothetical protein